MWKKPQQHTPRSKGERIGCMHGFFSLFSPGTHRKLLSDGPRRRKWYLLKNKKSKPKMLKNVDEKRERLISDGLSVAGKARSGAASVHSIKEEGMSRQNSEIQIPLVPDEESNSCSAKNEDKRVHQDQDVPEEITTATQMFNQVVQNCVQLSEDDPVLQRTIDEVLKNILVDKSPDPNQTETSQQQVLQDTHRSNKELLIKALQDPKIINLVLVKHSESLQQQSTVTENQHAFRTDLSENEQENSLLHKQKTQEEGNSHQRTSRIVILKPNVVVKNQDSSDASEPLSPSYSSCSSTRNKESEKRSFRLIAQEIKSRLREVFGVSKRHQELLTKDEFSYTAISESQASGSSDFLRVDDLKQAPHTLGNVSKPNKKRISTSFKEPVDVPGHVISPENGPHHSRYSSPTWSPIQKTTKPEQLEPSCINFEGLSCSSYNSTVELQMFESNSELLGNHVQEEDASTGETSSLKSYAVTIPQSNDPLEPSADVAEMSETNRPSSSSTLEQTELGSPLLQRTAAVVTSNSETSNSPRKTERRSPVSVLESLLLDKIIKHDVFRSSPKKMMSEDQEESLVNVRHLNSQTGLDQLCVRDEKFKYEYMRALVVASGLYQRNYKKIPPTLEASLYDEVETPSGEIPDDLKILFDCIAEVLEEIHKSSSDHMPWVSFIDPDHRPFPTGEQLVQRSWKGLNVHFVPWFPVTLEQVVKKDLDTGSWMDIRYGLEEFGTVLGDDILDDMLEETIHDLWG